MMCIYTYIIHDGEQNFLSRYGLHDLDECQTTKREGLPKYLLFASEFTDTVVGYLVGFPLFTVSGATGEFSRLRWGSRRAAVANKRTAQQTS